MKRIIIVLALAAAIGDASGCASTAARQAAMDIAQHGANVAAAIENAPPEQVANWQAWAKFLIRAAEIVAPVVLGVL